MRRICSFLIFCALTVLSPLPEQAQLPAMAAASPLGGVLGTNAAPAVRRERITRFDVSARVNPDASLTVREDLEFIASGIKITRGIVRAIPVRYVTAEGRPFDVGLKVLSTSVDGQPLPWKESDEGRGRLIRIGDPEHVLSHGTHRLSLIYETTKQLGFFETHDELYWNVTGNEWDMPIQSASFRLQLPGRGWGEDFTSVEWFTGPFGSRDTSGARETTDRTTVTTRSLQPGQGLTVVYTWPKGVVHKPDATFRERLSDFAWNNGGAIYLAIVGLACCASLLCLIVCVVRAGRNHSGDVTPVPLFHAPEDLTPSQSRFIMTEKNDTKSLSAEIVRLAIDGYLKISGNREEGYTLIKLPSKHEIANERRNLLDAIFPGEETAAELSNALHSRFENARNIVCEAVTARDIFDGGLLPLRLVFFVLGAGYLAASIFASSVPSVAPERVTGGIFSLIVCVFALSAVHKGLGKAFGGVATLMSRFLRLAVPLAVFGAAMLCEQPESLAYSAPAILAALAVPLLRPKLRRWTESGRKKLEQTLGLEMFIRAAAKDRMELLNAPDDTPELFEELLPWAIATDSVKNWTDRFAHVLEKCSYSPKWCDLPIGVGYFSAADFSSGFGAFEGGFSSSLSSASTPPGSTSGSSHFGGGGGSSGGGGGGGGGHGW